MSDPGGADVGGNRAQCAAAHSAIVQMRAVSGELSRAKSHLQTSTRAVLLIIKHQDASLLSLAKTLVSWFEARQYLVYVEEWLFRDVSPLCATSAPHPTQVRNWTVHTSQTSPEGLVDLVVTLGGDGTVLFAASLFQKQVPPIAPFHLGTVGFLTTFDIHEHEKHLNTIIFDRIRFCLRMRLSCILDTGVGKQPAGSDHDAIQVLNEVVIDRGPSPFMCLLDIFCNGHLISSVQTDGLIIGTPTGSTAYSLSAGGPMVHPEVPAILITPICPHSLTFRPLLLPDSADLEVKVSNDSRQGAWASFDGRSRRELRRGDSIRLRTSVWPVPTICSEDQTTDWFESLSRCLHWSLKNDSKYPNKSPI